MLRTRIIELADGSESKSTPGDLVCQLDVGSGRGGPDDAVDIGPGNFLDGADLDQLGLRWSRESCRGRLRQDARAVTGYDSGGPSPQLRDSLLDGQGQLDPEAGHDAAKLLVLAESSGDGGRRLVYDCHRSGHLVAGL